MRWISWQPLRTRLVAGTLLASVLSVWAAIHFIGQYLRADMEALISAQQYSTVALVAAEIDRSAKERIAILSDLARRIDQAGGPQPRIGTNILDAQSGLMSMFNWGVFVVDAEGKAVASIPEKLRRVGGHYGDLPFFQTVRDAHQPLISPPLVGRLTGAPIISIAVPIRRASGEFIGAVFGVTNLLEPNFLDQISNAKFGKSGDFVVTDARTRTYIASSDKQRVMKVGPRVGINPVYDQYIDGREGSGVAVSSRGVEELSSSVKIGDTGWLMQSVLPTDDAFAVVRQMQRRLMLFSLLFTFLAGVIAWWWVKKQLSPLERSARQLDEMRLGERPRESLPVEREDEIGKLATAFNALLASIQEQEALLAQIAATERVRKILSHVPGMVFQYYQHPDGTGAFPFASAAVRDIFGVTPEAIESDATVVRDLLVEEDREILFNSMQRSAERMERWLIDYRIRGSDGAIKWLHVDAVPEKEDGRIVWYGFVTDVTLNKALERELQDYRYRLEELVQERTEQLRVARDSAEAANVAKSAFLANMSHEIRTPLNAITGMAHLLRRSGLNERQTDKLDKIEAAGQHLLEIINAVLDLSKIEAGKFELEQAPIQLEEIVENVISMSGAAARAKGLHFSTSLASMPGGLLGDHTRLRQALLNYVSNAVKFTETGSIVISTRLLEDNPDNALVRIEVSDTGIGLTPESRARLFSAFEQADNSMTRKYGGTGLGLAITRKIAEIMGGEVGASSEAGQGSTFWFTARLKKAATGPASANQSASDDETALRTAFAGARILLAEDEPVNREVTLALLDDAGLHCDIAHDGAEAVELAAAHSYDLILMDMQMPNMDGLEATRHIRQQPGGASLPILALTANAFAEDKARCLEAGMNDFVSKPIAPPVFYRVLRQWLGRKNQD